MVTAMIDHFMLVADAFLAAVVSDAVVFGGVRCLRSYRRK
jgi:hypothetical protein